MSEEIYVQNPADFSTNGTVLLNVPGFSFPVVPGLYLITIRGIYLTVAITTGVGIALSGPAVGATIGINYSRTYPLTAATQSKQANRSFGVITAPSTGVDTANVPVLMDGTGILETANAGTVNVMIRSEVNLSQVTMRIRATLGYRQIA